jgi:acetate kinase
LRGQFEGTRNLLASTDPRARLALDYFVYRITKELGDLAAALGGLDALVFTAGIGDKSVSIRKSVLDRTKWLGFELDEPANQSNGPRITTSASKLPAYVIPTDEELMIAQHTVRLMRAAA